MANGIIFYKILKNTTAICENIFPYKAYIKYNISNI